MVCEEGEYGVPLTWLLYGSQAVFRLPASSAFRRQEAFVHVRLVREQLRLICS
jgi:hypothetical protein